MYLDSLKEHETILKTSKEKMVSSKKLVRFVCLCSRNCNFFAFFFFNKNIKDYLETNTKAVEFGV